MKKNTNLLIIASLAAGYLFLTSLIIKFYAGDFREVDYCIYFSGVLATQVLVMTAEIIPKLYLKIFFQLNLFLLFTVWYIF